MTLFNCRQTQFYNYVNGRKCLSPAEEKELTAIFAKYGVQTRQICDTYEEAYRLT